MRESIGLFPLVLVAGVVVLALGCQKKQEGEEAGAPVDTTVTTMTQEPSATGGGAAPAGGEAGLGQQVFEANCQTCHGAGGKGDGPAGAGLQPSPANFTDSEWKYGGDLASIKHTIENGVAGTAMIAWKGTLTDAEIEAVAKHEMAFSQGGATASAK
jgi:cbb3-type cytochrome c oxidase subunit III